MIEALSKRCAVSACVAFAVLLPAVAQAQTGTSTTKTDPKKPAADQKEEDKKKEAEKKTTEGDKKATEQQNRKREGPDEGEGHEKEEEEAKKAVFVSADIAFTRVDLGGIVDSLDFDKTAANGLLYGLAGGLRIRDFRFGGRWRVHDTTEYDLWSLAGSIGYGLPIRPLSPVFSVILGYVWDNKIDRAVFSSSLPRGTVLPSDVDVNGVLLGLDINASYWLTKFLRAGAFIGTDFMFLHREQAPLPASIFPIPDDIRARKLYTEGGTGIAYTINVGLRGAFDIGF